MRESLRRAALCALSALLGAAGPVRAAAPDAPFDRDEVAVDNTDFLLLTEKGYSFDNEGILRAANRMTVSREDAAYLLEDLRSRRRLADLLEIKLIQDRAASQGSMSAEDRLSLRRIGQRDWPLLSKSAKEQLKSVFNDRELYELNARSVAPQPDAASLLPAPVRPSQAHAAVPLDQPLKAFSGALMPLAAQAPAPVRPYVPPAPAPQTPPPAPPPAVPAPAPVVAAPPPPPAPVAEPIPLDIKPLPAPWAVAATPPPAPAAPVAPPAPVPPPAPAVPPAPPAPVIPPPPPVVEPPPPAPAPVVAAPPPPPVVPPAPVAPPPAPAPVDPNAPAPLPTDEELDTAEATPSALSMPAAPPVPAVPVAPAAPPPTIVRPPITDVTLASLPPAVAAAISAAPPPPPPAVAAVLPPAGGFRVDAAAPPPVREAEGLSPKALPTSAVVAPPVAPVPPPPPVELPAYLPVTPDAFAGFLSQAPYGREEKALLTMVSANLPEPDRTRALGVLMQRLPHVVLDSRRAGTESRVSVTVTPVPGQPLRETIALHDGPVFRANDAFLKADQAWLLPDDPAFYMSRGLSVPVAGAFSRESASAGEQATKWGRARVYPDGSKRLSRSETVLAGALTRGLLLLDARVRIPGDMVGAELAARVGEFRLYQNLEKAMDDDPPLDKETMALYAEWRDRPMDFVDTMAHGFFAAGAGTRIAAEAGLGVGKEPLRPAPQLPAAGSPAEAAWLESERLSREVSR